MGVGFGYDHVDAPARQDQLAKTAHLRSIRAALDSADSNAAQVRGAGGTAFPGDPAGGCSLDQGRWPYAELACSLREAGRGRGDAARRVAELLELLELPEDAAVWWHRAAESGDRDAAMYVAALDAS
ncbi:hypothetical protein [Amycolatopsis sp. Poz14]|uniref:hypothetical protein n=1 Tax=Amycolatopsis sp. Poz14 TaxID=1447705 RepID=UPI001EE8AFAE|nr:hypothetical protein [Amycolatopsis sp. Poz14]MCG3751849.1 hypothetical protein [Amycolatopsis sp. Poz14]